MALKMFNKQAYNTCASMYLLAGRIEDALYIITEKI
jgi:pentatricopeptide repeat protein